MWSIDRIKSKCRLSDELIELEESSDYVTINHVCNVLQTLYSTSNGIPTLYKAPNVIATLYKGFNVLQTL